MFDVDDHTLLASCYQSHSTATPCIYNMDNQPILDLLMKQNQILEEQTQTLRELKEAVQTAGQKSSGPTGELFH
jgi:hypothetical protein